MLSQYYVCFDKNAWYYYKLSPYIDHDLKIRVNRNNTEAVNVKLWVPIQPFMMNELTEISRRHFYKIVRLSNAKK